MECFFSIRAERLAASHNLSEQNAVEVNIKCSEKNYSDYIYSLFFIAKHSSLWHWPYSSPVENSYH